MNGPMLLRRLSDARARVLIDHPFFGRLLQRLSFGWDDCGTAYTDMKHIVFDPQFAQELSDMELRYVLIHEVLHCALKHCTRARGMDRFCYNVACDIVVNSTIMDMYNQSEIMIAGEPLMHLAPDGKEGRYYSAEKVYSMLMERSQEEIRQMYGLGGAGGQDDTGRGGIDCHDGWAELENTEQLEDTWSGHLRDGVKACGVGSGIPDYIARYLKEIDRLPRTNWRQVLHDFIQFDRSDYDFCRRDKRYMGDIIMPSFCEDMDGAKVEKLWFLVDTSGSVSNEAVSVAYNEIQQATQQIENISGWLSFFDTKVSEPEAFESLEDILSIKPIGCGGTSFRAIFEKLRQLVEEGETPRAVIILTDGYAPFPDEDAALGIPVIWIIVDSEVRPPWGTQVYISTKG